MRRNAMETGHSTRRRPAWRHLASLALLVMVSIGVSGCIVVPVGYWGHGGHHGGYHRDWR